MGMFKSMLTGPDGLTYDIVRAAFGLTAIGLISFTAFDIIVRHHTFDPIPYCAGFATLAGSAGIAIAAKQMAKAEPPHQG